jgi:hypothetical protein
VADAWESGLDGMRLGKCPSEREDKAPMTDSNCNVVSHALAHGGQGFFQSYSQHFGPHDHYCWVRHPMASFERHHPQSNEA